MFCIVSRDRSGVISPNKLRARNNLQATHLNHGECTKGLINESFLVGVESPHEHQQTVLLSRIITNVEKLNEAVMVMNKSLQEVNIQNMNVELVAQMFKNYQSNRRRTSRTPLKDGFH
ncbi:hypothetical protein NUU61_003510 [Penicillium alfredii]|uniref:DASH complex subunit DAD4 n=1 Tax=Penicillium alfredii TaxID=1506179 RepID=A0A9W9FJB4_9EURO|nr:uncharacterized protein NUU61_003510 [Penicillium alfredii]KAJ5101288.1 hypothetical protein NUU61_003510 [Penicillium alfredii]